MLDFLRLHLLRLPGWVRILATGRPEADVLSAQGAIGAHHPEVLEPSAEQNMEDLKQFILARTSGALTDEEKEEVSRILLEKSEVNTCSGGKRLRRRMLNTKLVDLEWPNLECCVCCVLMRVLLCHVTAGRVWVRLQDRGDVPQRAWGHPGNCAGGAADRSHRTVWGIHGQVLAFGPLRPWVDDMLPPLLKQFSGRPDAIAPPRAPAFFSLHRQFGSLGDDAMTVLKERILPSLCVATEPLPLETVKLLAGGTDAADDAIGRLGSLFPISAADNTVAPFHK